MSDIVFIPDGMIGFAGEKQQAGLAMALRKGGDEILFANRETPMPLTWIPIGQFTPDPKGLMSVEDVMEQEKEDEGFEE